MRGRRSSRKRRNIHTHTIMDRMLIISFTPVFFFFFFNNDMA